MKDDRPGTRERQKSQWWEVGIRPGLISMLAMPKLAESVTSSLSGFQSPSWHLLDSSPLTSPPSQSPKRFPFSEASCHLIISLGTLPGAPTSFLSPEKRAEMELVIREKKDLGQQLRLYCFYVSGYSYLNYDVMPPRDHVTDCMARLCQSG